MTTACPVDDLSTLLDMASEVEIPCEARPPYHREGPPPAVWRLYWSCECSPIAYCAACTKDCERYDREAREDPVNYTFYCPRCDDRQLRIIHKEKVKP